MPAELDEHVAALRQHPGAAAYFTEGFQFAVADLRRVCAVQSTVFTDSAEERTSEAVPGDLLSVAQVSLPIPQPVELPAQFDSVRQAWIFSSRNPNLRIPGTFGGPVQPGLVGFGFLVSVLPSFMQVAGFRGRVLLRDGYHRAFGLLRRGIGRDPVFYREYETFEDLQLSAGMLPQDAYLGSRPATLGDYLLDDVAKDAQLPASQKMILIQGTEITPLG
jgi:hypothetical protein